MYDQEMPQPHTANQSTSPRGIYREHEQSHDTKGNYSKVKSSLSLAPSISLFPSEIIAKQETTPSTAQQNKDLTQDSHKTMREKINNESTSTEAPP